MTFWRHEDALAALDEQIPVEGGHFLEISIPLDRSKKQDEERPTTRKDRPSIPSDKREKETSKQPASNNTQARNKPQPRPAKVEFIERFSRFVYVLALDLLSCFHCYNQTAVLNSASGADPEDSAGTVVRRKKTRVQNKKPSKVQWSSRLGRSAMDLIYCILCHI